MTFIKGDPRINREGRPKGSYSVVEMIKRKLDEIPEGKDKTYGELFVSKIMEKISVDGDVSMMRDIIDRFDGKPKQNVDMKVELNNVKELVLKSYDDGNGENSESI